MIRNEDMALVSKSGYCMPFDDRGEEVNLTLSYGEQEHPQTGEKFFHHGIDLMAHYFMLHALADGKVTGIGSDTRHGMQVTVTYDEKYAVKYAHLSGVHVTFGQPVRAGTVVGVSGRDLLHVEVRYKDEELNPVEFIAMLYANVKSQYAHLRPGEQPELVNLDLDVHTRYDRNQEEVEQLMLNYYPAYMEELLEGSYTGGEHTLQSLRNLFSLGQAKHLFFDTLPSMANPMGLTQRGASLAAKAQDLLIGDFLNYLAIRQHIFLSGMSEAEKKN